MWGLSPLAIALAGLCAGLACGFFVRRARLCTFGAIETALVGGDWRKMKVFGLALAVALLGTQSLIFLGLLEESQTPFLHSRVPWLSVAIGSVMFGLGMALVGTCSFGSVIRLGTGDLRALVSLLVFGLLAYATLRGVLSPIRVGVLEAVAVEMPGSAPSSLVTFVGQVFQGDVRILLAAASVAILAGVAVSDSRLRRSPRMLAAAIVLGVSVTVGWLVTSALADPFSQVRVQSLTFVAPIARGLYAGLLGSAEWIDFGVATVPGVLLGAFLAALIADEFRWEAFDDAREMRRHIAGAALMGVGGVLAGGCTIGQGLSAGSLFAITWPIALAGMMLGARLGLLILVEGSLRDALQSRWPRWRKAIERPPAE
jgi:uncharacterized membrane protein YedE/YeeE